MRVALIQTNASDDPAENLSVLRSYLAEAAADGARFVLTPEVSNCLSASRTRQREALHRESDDPMLAAVQKDAAELGMWVLIGSLALKTDDPAGRLANRSFLINPDGEIRAHYDKIHMFDVQISPEETYRESDGYRPGSQAVLAETDFAKLGLTICYDLRFPGLYRDLARKGAGILTVPSAFARPTGAAHWETLLRARAIECGAFVLAPAQTGQHRATRGKSRKTWGHSMAIDPWGTVLLDAGTDPGVYTFNIDMDAVAAARSRIPSLTTEDNYSAP